MNIFASIKMTLIDRFVDFSGRSSRSEYWLFFAFNIIMSIILSGVDAVLGTGGEAGGVFSAIYALLVLIPGIALAVRRLHDTDRTGWWYLLIFIPFLGWLALFIFFLLPGTEGKNSYGEPHKIPA